MESTEYVLGVDIGGTFTKCGFVTREGNCFSEFVIETSKFIDVDSFIDKLIAEYYKALKKLPGKFKIKGVGIGAPNGNFHYGTIENAANLHWKGIVPVAEKISAKLKLKVKLTNDANAAALGEMLYGSAKGVADFIMITLGTGLGSGIVSNGALIYGHDGFAGELGHVNVEENGRPCGCGNKGCLETYVSATGIKITVLELLKSGEIKSELSTYSDNDITSELIYKAAIRNDKLALKAFEITGKILGKKLADTVLHTSPKSIFLFGGLAAAGPLILKPAKRYMEESLMKNFKNKVDVLPSGLINKNAAVLGAAALIWNK